MPSSNIILCDTSVVIQKSVADETWIWLMATVTPVQVCRPRVVGRVFIANILLVRVIPAGSYFTHTAVDLRKKTGRGPL